MNLDIKQLINLDAFTKGLSTTTRSLGGIVPIAAINMIESRAESFGSGIPYGTDLINGGFFLWKVYTAQLSMMNS